MKTQDEIEKQITALKEVRPKVRPYSYFGDDNLAALDAQIKVLEEDLDDDEIYDEWPGEESEINIRGAADKARNWIDGGSESDDLATDWPLVEKE